MIEPIFLDTALCLPYFDVEALKQRRVIAAMPRIFVEPGRQFAILPTNYSNVPIPIDNYYHKYLQPIPVNTMALLNSNQAQINIWAKCEKCQILDASESIGQLSNSTIWTEEGLQSIISQYDYIFLAYLRVYKLPQTIETRVKEFIPFIPLEHPILIQELLPLLSDRKFYQCKYQLENRLSSLFPQLEKLQSIISKIRHSEPKAELLENDIKSFLGWYTETNEKNIDSDIRWISTIASIGNSSDGDTFEKRVRQSFIKLGFSNSNINPKVSLDPNSCGGAGGLDFYCEYPYPVVGECKATRTEKVPDGTAAQLVKLGYKHLQHQYNSCIKIIMAAGELTEDAELTASGNQMNVIRPETLQRLVELKAYHPGSLDLLELKNCLEQEPFGEAADTKVNHYIDSIWQNIKVRIHIINIVKNANKKVGIEYLSGAYDASSPPKILFNIQELHEILIELSSPLTGYLGRIKGEDWRRDRFYFLRDLLID